MGLLSIFKKHVCNYNIKLYDIQMENNTSYLVTQCKCGKTKLRRVHNNSIAYQEYKYNVMNVKD